MLIERATGLKDGESDMDEFAHGGTRDGFAILAVGFQTLTEGTNDGVVLPSDQCRQVQGFTQGGVTGLGDTSFPGPRAGRLDPGRKAGVGDGLLGVGEALMRTQCG